MPVIKGTNNTTPIYHGEDLIEKVYHGINLVYSSKPSEPQVESTPGFICTRINLPSSSSAIYEYILVSGVTDDTITYYERDEFGIYNETIPDTSVSPVGIYKKNPSFSETSDIYYALDGTLPTWDNPSSLVFGKNYTFNGLTYPIGLISITDSSIGMNFDSNYIEELTFDNVLFKLGDATYTSSYQKCYCNFPIQHF